MFRKLKDVNDKAVRQTVQNAKKAIKEEVEKTADSVLPKIIAGTFIALVFLASIPPQKFTSIPPQTINVFYIGR